MSQGPSKLLYACGGWFLGGLAGGILGIGVMFAIGSFAPQALATALLASQIIALSGSVIGAISGWKKATHEQQKLQTQQESPSQNRSRYESASPSIEQEIAQETGQSFAARVQPKLVENSYSRSIANEPALQQQASR